MYFVVALNEATKDGGKRGIPLGINVADDLALTAGIGGQGHRDV